MHIHIYPILPQMITRGEGIRAVHISVKVWISHISFEITLLLLLGQNYPGALGVRSKGSRRVKVCISLHCSYTWRHKHARKCMHLLFKMHQTGIYDTYKTVNKMQHSWKIHINVFCLNLLRCEFWLLVDNIKLQEYSQVFTWNHSELVTYVYFVLFEGSISLVYDFWKPVGDAKLQKKNNVLNKITAREP